MTNTNWQSYAGESTLGCTAQAAGLMVQNFASAAVGIAVAAALLRGFAARQSSELGNFWVDLIRIVVRVLLPLAVVVAVLLLAFGVIQNLAADRVISTVVGGSQTLPGGPVASQEAIKESNYLRVFMAQLRRKVEVEPSRPRHFLTEPGVGHRFVP